MNAPDNTLRGRFTTTEDVQRFVQAGNAIITLVSRKTGARYTYSLRRPQDERDTNVVCQTGIIFVGVLTGPDNTTHYRYVGQLRGDGITWRYEHGRRAKLDVATPSVVAFRWFAQQLYGDHTGGTLPDQLEVWHEGRCGRCGRMLTVPTSVARGFGPDCASLMNLC